MVFLFLMGLILIVIATGQTINGACYYYTTGSKYSNYEDVLVAVKKDADDNGLPFRYVQVDSGLLWA
jgi:hypothetical protein